MPEFEEAANGDREPPKKLRAIQGELKAGTKMKIVFLLSFSQKIITGIRIELG